MLKVVERIDRIHQLIKMKATGSPVELAYRLKISERMVYQYLNLMREMGAPIKFDRVRRSYYYEYEIRFSFGFFQS